MSIYDDIEALGAGTIDELASTRIRNALLLDSLPQQSLYAAITVYIDESLTVDWTVAEKYVKYPSYPMAAAAAIAAAGLRRCPSAAFWKAVEDVAAGEAWDVENAARTQAILTLNRNPSGCGKATKQILRLSLKDSSPTIRDCAAIALQRCVGTAEPHVITKGENGSLVKQLPMTMIQWLGTDGD